MPASSGSPAKPLVSVLTPTIQGREQFLEECKASVYAQTDCRLEHLTWLDVGREGCAASMNRLARMARGEWLIPLADDDLLLPNAVRVLLEASEDADIVYAPPLVSGNEDRWWFFQAPPAIPSFALIRADLWRELGGYNETLIREEDRDLWVKALEAGARFKRVDGPCWVYRQHAGNKSFRQGLAA